MHIAKQMPCHSQSLAAVNPDWFYPSWFYLSGTCSPGIVPDKFQKSSKTIVCVCVMQKEDSDWVKKCMEYEVEGARPRGRPKKTWREIVVKDCQARGLNREDAMDRVRWKKLIRDD